MVAVINTGYSIRSTFLYNENKLDAFIIGEKGEKIPAATLLDAANYPMELKAMGQGHRLKVLLRMAERNPEVERNSVHISLNFAPDEHLFRQHSSPEEQAVADEKIRAIAAEYMEAIGFGQQPYLLYRHHDATHPHLHIVTVKVGANGRRIDTQNIGKTLSETARKAIEARYGLVRAEDHKRSVFQLKPVDAAKVIYGKTETRRAIYNVLQSILYRYKYTSIAELNAVLNLYNVQADTGSADSRILAHQGLQYRILDAAGQPVGIPIKASLFHFKPTLKNIRKRFNPNREERIPHAERLKYLIALSIKKTPGAYFRDFKKLLKRSGVDLTARINESGRLYGITYVDHKTRCVFNGSDLGKEYSANAIAERFPLIAQGKTIGHPALYPAPPQINTQQEPAERDLWEILSSSEYVSSYTPVELRGKKRKKKKRNHHLPNY
ncbi:relaxase/mobilization nuclease domain-containing protein [Chitinophaga barathri]|uniref:Relaxase n=1 Tax=Chitinophaga barathri TaxID=1647451 RepID=A0A3N4M7P1_9BACT|nr:relaxase/mobilization nuclease domain-containing protein [Chitinophaga barathri]RPD39308.1 relaxase [Chitinophaga barathri]